MLNYNKLLSLVSAVGVEIDANKLSDDKLLPVIKVLETLLPKKDENSDGSTVSTAPYGIY